MKLFAKLMIAVLFIALLLPFTILKDENGRTLMSFSDFSLPDFSMPSLPKLANTGSKASVDGSSGGKDIFYKWYDADGNVQFTTEPPADGIEYTIKGFDPNTNVIQAVKTPVEDSGSGDSTPTPEKTNGAGDIGNPYSQESVKKLFEDAENIEKLLQQRFQDQNSAINQ